MTHPTGLQIAFLLFALNFGAMLVARPITAALDLAPEHFNTLGLLIVMPLELALVLCLPALRSLVLDGLARPLTVRGSAEAVLASIGKLMLTFGIWGAFALWALYVAGQPDVFRTGYFTDDPRYIDARYFSPWGLVRAAVAVTLAPVVEEVVFRGVLYRLWERQWGWGAGMLLSSIAFALVHPGNGIQTFLSSIVYVCLYRRTGSLYAPILCHILYNLLVTWPLFGHVLMVRSRESAGSIDGWWIHLACLVVGVVALLAYLWHSRYSAQPR